MSSAGRSVQSAVEGTTRTQYDCRHAPPWCLAPPPKLDVLWHTAVVVGDVYDSRQSLAVLNMHLVLQVAKVGAFTSKQVSELSTEIDELQQRAAEASPGSKDSLTKVGAVSARGRYQSHEGCQITMLDVGR